jgi:putative membrane protein
VDASPPGERTSPITVVADPDSRARTHLANERTFLAWFRTGLTTIALGLAAGQFLAGEADPERLLTLGLATIVTLLGIFLVLVGVVRYVGQRFRIDRARYRPADRSIVISAAAGIAAGLVAILFLWLLRT